MWNNPVITEKVIANMIDHVLTYCWHGDKGRRWVNTWVGRSYDIGLPDEGQKPVVRYGETQENKFELNKQGRFPVASSRGCNRVKYEVKEKHNAVSGIF